MAEPIQPPNPSARKPLTAERLRQLLHYDPETGIFRWLVNRGRLAKAGDIAGGPDGYGYIGIMVDGRSYRGHRLAWLWMEGWVPDEIDHEDTMKSNNRWKNLRPATSSQNMANKRLRSDNKSGIAGVYWYRWTNRWAATVGRHTIGYFKTREEAHEARKKAALAKYGEFARVE